MHVVINEIRCKVLDALPRDVGRLIARLPLPTMKTLGITTGEVIKIQNRDKIIAAFAWPDRTFLQFQNEHTIRLDETMRHNLNVKVGDYVTVSKAEVLKARKIIVAKPNPHVHIMPQDILRELNGKPVVARNMYLIPYLGRKVPIYIVSTEPQGIVLVHDGTYIELVLRKVLRRRAVTFKDVGGLDHVIKKLREIVELPLKHPELFERLGITPPSGILLYGPPGCGKTLLARALANEIDAYFIAISGPEIVSKFYGESEERLRRIFDEAKRNAPSIIFIDEIDAIAVRRAEVIGEVEKRIVAQLLALMDGLEPRDQVIVIGATNRIEAIDPALRRPGRFDVEIEVPVPDERGRYEILKIHTRNVPLDKDVDLQKLAEITHGFVGADLAALVKEAAIRALRRFLKEEKIEVGDPNPIPPEKLSKLKVTMKDFMNALREIRPSAMREIAIEVPKVHWSDIGGLEEVKQTLQEIVEWPIKYRKLFEQFHIEVPKGVLLFGPPGCGKTLLAKAVATESEANFIAVRGPEVLSKWVGESEKRIREIFRKARIYAPCIIFFDEIDAIAPRRGMFPGSAGVIERVISQLLTELDGIQTRGDVVVIAATNRPDILDPALLRPGRFDRVIYVPPPDFRTRVEILKVHTRNIPLAEDVDIEDLARRTEFYSGADLAAIVREAALNAIRRIVLRKEKIQKVTAEDFEYALTKIRPSLSPEILKYYEELKDYFLRRVFRVRQRETETEIT